MSNLNGTIRGLLLLLPFASVTLAQIAPTVTVPPQSQAVTVGANAVLSVAVSGSGPISYEWWNDFGPLYPAQTNATLDITDVGFSDAASYKVFLRNAAGSTTSALALLSVTGGEGFITGDNFLLGRKAGGTGFEPGGNIAADTAGNTYVVASFTGSLTLGGLTLTSRGGSDISVVKYGRSGTVLWARQAGGTEDDYGAGIVVDRAGNIHVIGSITGSATFGDVSLTSNGGTDGFVSKYDRTGNLLWARQFGGSGSDKGRRITADLAGNSYVIGTFAGSVTVGDSTLVGSGGNDVFVAKYGVSGSPLWASGMGGSGHDTGTGIAVDTQGNSYVAGHFQGQAQFAGTVLTSSGLNDAFVGSFNSSGLLRWIKPVRGIDTNVATVIAVDLQGNCYLSGSFIGTALFGGTTLVSRAAHDLFLARLDRAGNWLWAVRVGSTQAEEAGVGLTLTDAGAVTELLSGTADFSDGAESGTVDLFTAKYDIAGHLVWGRQAGASFANFALALLIDDHGNRNLAGYFEESPDASTPNGSGEYDLLFAQLDSSSPVPPPYITVAPRSEAILAGGSATLSVSASGPGLLTYQWRLNGVDLNGKTSPTLARANFQAGQEGVYQVVVSNAGGTATSPGAVLTLDTPALAPLVITIIGKGSVTPDLDGRLLEIGKTYTLTAHPAPRFLFDGWAGEPVGAAAQLTFVMQPSLTLQATFVTNNSPLPDPIPPTLTIVAPGPKAWLTNANLTVQGSARDNVAVARVEFQLGAGEFQSASGTTNWSAAIVLTPGTNLFRVRSIDGSNNVSSIVTRIFTYNQMSPLTLMVAGDGKVTPNLTGTSLIIGRRYSLSATPAAGNVFSNWTGTMITNESRISFVMEEGMVVQANFVPNPFLGAEGSYAGLFYESAGVRHESSGFSSLAVTTQGRFTGVLLGGGRRLPFSGKFDLAGKATNVVVRAGTNALTVELQLGLGQNSALVTGRVREDNWGASLTADRAAFHSVTNRAPFAGRYTLIAPGTNDAAQGPGGDGFGTAVVGAGGRVALNATLGDGTAAIQNVPVSKNGSWPLYISLYNGKGSVLSWVTFTNGSSGDLSGRASWTRPGLPSSRLYSGGFTNETVIVGSSYTPPPASTKRVLELTNGSLLFTSGNLSAPLLNDVVLTQVNNVVNLSSNRLTLKLMLATGLFNGSVVDPRTGVPIAFKGALLQKGRCGAGFFMGTNQTGLVFLCPSPTGKVQ